MKARKQAWSAAIGAGSEPQSAGPTRLAYRWVRGLIGWTKCALGPASLNDEVLEQQTAQFDDIPTAQQDSSHCHGPIMPLAEQAEVNKAADDWGNAWGEHLEYRAAQTLLSTGTVDRLPPLSPDDLAAAGRSFPRDTALGSDNVSPAVYAQLPHIALLVLCLILSAAEKAGRWPACLDSVFIILLAKAGGGRRPIGCFRSPIRICGRR